MQSLVALPTAAQKDRALEHVQRLIEWKRRDSPPRDLGEEVRSVGIVGAGMMGRAIAVAHLKRGLPVVMTDADRAVLEAAHNRIVAELAEDLSIDAARKAADDCLQTADALDDVAPCDLVLESIVENPVAKQSLYSKLEAGLADAALLASNTSTIPISRLGTNLRRPERFLGFHFFHPVARRPLVELIRGQHTSPETMAAADAHARAIGHTPIHVADGPGFLVNRLLFPCLGEALELLVEGVSVETVDRAAVDFGLAKGPLELIDEIGLDVALHSAIALAEAFDDRIPRSGLLVSLVKAGHLGCKSGKGFYTYTDQAGRCERGQPDEALSGLLARWTGKPRTHTPESITQRLVLPMALEATRVLQDGVVDDPREVDLAVLLGLGFPPERGGLLWWADQLGAAALLAALHEHAYLGPRGEPTPSLVDMARSGQRFYPAGGR